MFRKSKCKYSASLTSILLFINRMQYLL